MPAVSKNQAIAARIAKHEPGKLYKRNRGLLKMDKKDLSHFASTKEKGLPSRVTRDGVVKELKRLRK